LQVNGSQFVRDFEKEKEFGKLWVTSSSGACSNQPPTFLPWIPEKNLN
jgi:hypothetical protein